MAPFLVYNYTSVRRSARQFSRMKVRDLLVDAILQPSSLASVRREIVDLGSISLALQMKFSREAHVRPLMRNATSKALSDFAR